MSRTLLVSIAVLACVVLLSVSAHAQQDRRTVTVLSFDAVPSQADAASALYGAVRTQVTYHRELALNDVPPQSLDELLLAVGCMSLDAECVELVRMVIDVDWLVYGELHEAGAELTIFDVNRGQTLRTVALTRAPGAWVERDDVLLARHLLWGNVGAIVVESTPPGATVYLDDLLVGVTPVEASQLALRGSTLRVERPGYAPHVQRVEVDLGLTEVDVRLAAPDAASAARERTRTGDGETAAWVTAGAGAVLLGAGVVTGIESRQTQSAFDRAVDSVELDRDRAEALRDRGDRQAMAANVLLPLGATTLIGGVVWALVGRKGEASVADALQGTIRF